MNTEALCFFFFAVKRYSYCPCSPSKTEDRENICEEKKRGWEREGGIVTKKKQIKTLRPVFFFVMTNTRTNIVENELFPVCRS